MGNLYKVNEVFLSVQGEGERSGKLSVFVRLSGCNLSCTKESAGFNCDTEHEHYRELSAEGVVDEVVKVGKRCVWVVLTGGEPGLQVDELLVNTLKAAGFMLAIETNGTVELPGGIDWVTVCPKPGTVVRQTVCNELKVVLAHGQELPHSTIDNVLAPCYVLSPAFEGNELPRENLEWCMAVMEREPRWRLSPQLHKLLGLR